jgi:hypothetical protein
MAEEFIQLGLFDSLVNPNVVERRGDSYWIEFCAGGYRVGYLVATVEQDKIVIRTFLFLTMEGTPEYQLLSSKLGLSRWDIEYASLDRLETFLNPSLRDDAALVQVLEECGCTPLLALAKECFRVEEMSDRAEALREFLCITCKGGQILFKGVDWPFARRPDPSTPS